MSCVERGSAGTRRRAEVTPRQGTTAGLLIFLMVLCFESRAQEMLPDGFALEDVVSSGLVLPTSIAFFPGGDGEFLAAEKGGRVLFCRDGQISQEAFVDLSAQVNQHGDRGLAGVAIHPDFPEQPFVYLSFSYDPPGLPGAPGEPDGPDGKGKRISRVIRVSADPATGHRTMLEGSEKVIFGEGGDLGDFDPGPDDLEPICETGGDFIENCAPSESHAHGMNSIAFGPDGALYFSHGEGSNALLFDRRALRSQYIDSLSGKIFRVDPMTGEGLPDNPFFDGDPSHNRSKVLDYGVRNPFRFTFHPETGEIFFGDVGWDSWEEIDKGTGLNFGWPCYEGPLRQPAFEVNPASEAVCAELYDSGEATDPVYHYRRSPTGGALILGDFYTGESYPKEYANALFFADFNDRWIRILRQDHDGNWEARPFGWNVGPVVQLVPGPGGDLHLVMIYTGAVRRLVYNGANRKPDVSVDANPRSGSPPLEVHFSSVGTTDPEGSPLTYLWHFGDGTSSTEPHPVHTFAQPGLYGVSLTVEDEAGASARDELEIAVDASKPTVTIVTPSAGEEFAIGDQILLEGTAFDPEEGELDGESLEWSALLHHASHVHPDHFHGHGRTEMLEIDDHGDDTWIELILTATDSTGAKGHDVLALRPREGSLVLDTRPNGLELVYGSQRSTAPLSLTPPVGGARTVTAPAVQNHLSFFRWSDRSTERTRSVVIEDSLQSLIAYYVNHPPEAKVSVTTDPLERRVSFTGNQSRDPEGDELAFHWDFGDGTTSMEANPVHTFEEARSYRVALTVRDALGASDEVVTYVYLGSRRRAATRQ